MRLARPAGPVLPDILGRDLRIVFCGTAAGEKSAARGHYYAGPGSAFWRLLAATGLTPRLLTPDDDALLPTFGLGLTDLVKDIAQSHDRGLVFDVPGLVEKIERHQPRWLAFTSKTGGRAAATALGHPPPALGPTSWSIGSTRVFVLPSPSGANHRRDYDGRPTRQEWWAELAQLSAASIEPTLVGRSRDREQ